MKKHLKIKFVDFWVTFNPTNNSFWNELVKYYDLELSDNPEVIFYSVFGKEYLNYKCHRIFYTGENVRPNFNECDLALSFDYIEDSRHIRLPLYTRLFDLTKLTKSAKENIIYPIKTKFCCMVVSNANCEFRNEFFNKLSEYKTVDSGGKYANNIGYIVPDKLEFIKDYKFVISFENSEYPGYTTEKIVEPMLCGSIPIYWGNPFVDREFDTKSFVNVYDYNSIDDVINRIAEMDKDDNLFALIQRKSNLVNNELQYSQNINVQLDILKDRMEMKLKKKPVNQSINGKLHLIYRMIVQIPFWKKIRHKLFNNFKPN
jgi:hypothetical protein